MAQGNVFEYDVSSWKEKKPEKGGELSEMEHGEPFDRAFRTEGVDWRMLFSSSKAVSDRSLSIMEVQ